MFHILLLKRLIKSEDRGRNMKFDKSKILTCVTADQLKGREYGWFGDTIAELEKEVGVSEMIQIYAINGPTRQKSFVTPGGKHYLLFYPAPYYYLQEQWVKKNALKFPDKLRVVRPWVHEDGFSEYSTVDKELTFDSALENSIFCHGEKSLNVYVPYYALEKIEDSGYRPFASAEEFAPYRNEWWRHKKGGNIFNLRYYDDFGVAESTYDTYTYDVFFESYVFADTGEPAGVKL